EREFALPERVGGIHLDQIPRSVCRLAVGPNRPGPVCEQPPHVTTFQIAGHRIRLPYRVLRETDVLGLCDLQALLELIDRLRGLSSHLEQFTKPLMAEA